MSVYNGQNFLAEAVDSILSQTFSDFEFLIIDDGSTDNTAEILSARASRDQRIRIITQENKGRATSLNIGIAAAKSDYIARMDADDIALPDRFQLQFDFLERHPEVGLLGGSVELIKAAGRVLGAVRPPREDAEIKAIMLHDNPMLHPTVVMRKSIVLAVGGYRKPLLDADDYDLFLRMGEQTRIANLTETLVHYRIHANQVSVKNMLHQTECVLAARAAAGLRKRGVADPLIDIDAVTPLLLRTLSVTHEQVQRKVIDAYHYWIQLLNKVDPDSTLVVIDQLLQLPGPRKADRATFADALLAAANIHYRRAIQERRWSRQVEPFFSDRLWQDVLLREQLLT